MDGQIESGSAQDRRKGADHETVVLIIRTLGKNAGWLGFCLGAGFLLSIGVTCFTGKEPVPGLTLAIGTGIVGAMGNTLGNIGSLLTNAHGNASTPQQVGQAVVNAAHDAEGIEVKAAEPSPVEGDKTL